MGDVVDEVAKADPYEPDALAMDHAGGAVAQADDDLTKGREVVKRDLHTGVKTFEHTRATGRLGRLVIS